MRQQERRRRDDARQLADVSRSAVDHLKRRIALAREALSVNDYIRRTDPAVRGRPDAGATRVELEHDIAEMESELADLERRQRTQ